MRAAGLRQADVEEVIRSSEKSEVWSQILEGLGCAEELTLKVAHSDSETVNGCWSL